uniref:Uncharacterized protein n=1 Tax=Caenorhabditis japonica TaxID=281687 RepID=A0A8R1DPQ0_CAEJA
MMTPSDSYYVQCKKLLEKCMAQQAEVIQPTPAEPIIPTSEQSYGCICFNCWKVSPVPQVPEDIFTFSESSESVALSVTQTSTVSATMPASSRDDEDEKKKNLENENELLRQTVDLQNEIIAELVELKKLADELGDSSVFY